jgi:hypothetical protein
MQDQTRNKPEYKSQLTIWRLSRCTGFPSQTLRDFAERGLLPKVSEEIAGECRFDGLALLRKLGEIEDAK